MTYLRLPDEILAAAADLRAAAKAAGGRAWAADHFPEGTVVRPADSTRSLLHLHADGSRAAGTPCVSKPVGAYIARVGPIAGLALADLLEAVANSEDAYSRGHDGCDPACCPPWAALKVSRALMAAPAPVAAAIPGSAGGDR